jgi:hypothetical protein
MVTVSVSDPERECARKTTTRSIGLVVLVQMGQEFMPRREKKLRAVKKRAPLGYLGYLDWVGLVRSDSFFLYSFI